MNHDQETYAMISSERSHSFMKNWRRARGYLDHHSVLLSRGDADWMIKVRSEHMAVGTISRSTKDQYSLVIE